MRTDGRKRGPFRRRLAFEQLEWRRLLASSWQNPFNPIDIDDDGLVVPRDVQIGVTELNRRTVVGPYGQLPDRVDHPQAPFYDSNGDGWFTPRDILLIINALNTDDQPPEIIARLAKDTAPGGATNDDGVTSDPTISGTARDATGVASLEAQVDDGPMFSVALDRAGNFRFSTALALDGSADGLHVVRLQATDARHNVSRPVHVEFRLDTQAPDRPKLAVVGASVWEGNAGPGDTIHPDATVGANQLTVTNTGDSGPGSLRQAIIDANQSAGPDVIQFNISPTDPGFNTANPVGRRWWTIQLESPLPSLADDGIEIRGFTQTANQGDTNQGVVGTGGTVGVDRVPLPQYQRAEIAVDANGFDGLTIGGNTSHILIEGLAIYDANYGIWARGGSGAARQVRETLVGVFPDGSDPGAQRNRKSGIRVDGPGELTVIASYVGFNGRVGVVGSASTSVLHVRFSEVFGNGWNSDDHDGIDLNGINGSALYNLSRDNVNFDDDVNGPEFDTGSGSGIELGSQAAGTGGNRVENNTSRGNISAGIAIRNGSTGNTVAKNVVTENHLGITVSIESSSRTNGNTLSQNSIFGNRLLGIDLYASQGKIDGVTPNDPKDVDTGSNDLQNYPVLTSATVGTGDTAVAGTLNSTPNSEFIVEFFSNSACDQSRHGEGEVFLGAILVTTDGAGDAAFTATVPALVPAGYSITATATGPNGSTSEFSQCVPVRSSSEGESTTADVDEKDLTDSHARGHGEGNNVQYVTPSNSPTVLVDAEPGSLVKFYVDGSLADQRIANGQLRLAAGPLSEGAHVLSATSEDVAGNISDFSSLSVTVDSVPPWVVIYTPVESGSHEPDGRLRGVLGDAGVGVSSAQFALDGGTLTPLPVDALGRFNKALASEPLDHGLHQVRVAVTDAVGNATSWTVHFRVDAPRP